MNCRTVEIGNGDAVDTNVDNNRDSHQRSSAEMCERAFGIISRPTQRAETEILSAYPSHAKQVHH